MMPLTEWIGRAFRKVGTDILTCRGIKGTWIDVGAHHGEVTLGYARHNPGLRIYAFEPNLHAAARLFGHAPNYVVIPMAIAEQDGYADFHINEFEAASSLLPLNENAPSWSGGTKLKLASTTAVATVRLDTFMNLVGIKKVDFLKVDAQGMDLAVVKSAGSRLRDIEKITLEVWLTSQTQYLGASSKGDVLKYMGEHGFSLTCTEAQTDGLEENLTFVRTGRVQIE